MYLKISLRNQFYALKELVIISFVYFGLMGFLYIKAEFDLFKILFISTFFLYLIIFLLPVIILHINYLNNSKYKSVAINENKLTIDENVFIDSDIDRIIIFATNQHFNNSVGVSALPYNDHYYYIEICLKTGDKINLTSLLDYKIDMIVKENFKSVNIVEKNSTLVLLLINKN